MAERSVGRSGAVVAAGTTVSRALGLVNALLLYNTIGTQGQSADAFALANTLPNYIYAIIAGGTLTAVVVPAIVRAAGHEDGGERFLNRLVTLALTLFASVTVAVTVAAPLIVHLYAQAGGDDGRGFPPAQLALTYAFAYWCLPQVFFYAVFAVLSEVLNARGRFWAYAWAPIVNNLVFVAVLLTFRFAFGSAAELAASEWSPGMVALLAGGATLGIAAQALVLVFAWRRAGLRFRPDFHWRGAGLGRFGRTASWTFGMVLVGQAIGIAESNVASLATGEASIAAMGAAWLMFMLPFSIVTMSIIVPYFTRMSRDAASGDLDAMSADLSAALRTAVMLQVFCAVGLAVLSPWVAPLFDGDPSHAGPLALVLSCYLLGLVPLSLASIAQRAFFAFEDTRTPFFLQLGQAALVGVGLIVIAQPWVPKDRIAMSIALALSLACLVQSVVALSLAKRRIPGLRLLPLLGRLAWAVAAMIPAAAIGWGIGAVVRSSGAGSGWIPSFATAVVAGAAMLIVYGAIMWLTRNPEARAFLSPALARLRRRAE